MCEIVNTLKKKKNTRKQAIKTIKYVKRIVNH